MKRQCSGREFSLVALDSDAIASTNYVHNTEASTVQRAGVNLKIVCSYLTNSGHLYNEFLNSSGIYLCLRMIMTARNIPIGINALILRRCMYSNVMSNGDAMINEMKCNPKLKKNNSSASIAFQNFSNSIFTRNYPRFIIIHESWEFGVHAVDDIAGKWFFQLITIMICGARLETETLIFLFC
uniref:Uncharacterized protein n=1 Tax=Glossina pallidipes TaxID=7398 RepID=A0A1B0A6K9_GLOPL